MTDLTTHSRLLTLVFTDLADSTALKTQRGDGAIASLISRHAAHVKRLAGDCGGRIIDWAGDGCFLTFNTSSSAVLFALRLQQAHADESDLPGVRIGVHMGEVTETENETGAPHVAGLAVDLASRICGLARPGQVLMSASVYDSARQRIGVESLGKPILWQAHGTYAVKGFDKEIDIGEAGVEGIAPLSTPTTGDKAKLVRRAAKPGAYSASASASRILRRVAIATSGVLGVLAILGAAAYWAGRSQTQIPPGDGTLGPISSLAVLPLDNLSNNPDHDVFADGMTEAITSELSKIKAINVKSRTSVMRFKDTQLPIGDIAQQLGVEGLIEGSVQRDGDDVKITVQLIHGPSDTHLWSNSYMGEMKDVLKLESDVALAIAEAIKAELTGDERERIAKSHEVDPRAYDLYAEGLRYRVVGTPEQTQRSIQLFEEAVRIDPQFAEAWSTLAYLYCIHPNVFGGDARDIVPRARDAALRALQLDGDLPAAHLALGFIAASYDWEWNQAEARFRQSVELDPGFVRGHVTYGWYFMLIGRNREAQAQVQLVPDLLAQDPWTANVAARVLATAGELEQARSILEWHHRQAPDFEMVRGALINVYSGLGDDARAVELADEQIQTGSRTGFAAARAAMAYALAGQTERAREVVDSALASESTAAKHGAISALVLLGDLDQAFQLLDQAIEMRLGYVNQFRVQPYEPRLVDHPNMIRFRNDPRYHQMVATMNFPPLPPEHAGYAEEQAWLAQKQAEAESNAPIRSIAVLPFDNLRADPAEDYFADGMTEALIAELAKIKNIKVISRTSVMQYKDVDDKTMPEIARELGVDSLVEGSVLKDGEQVRITAQLIRGVTDEHLWSESFTNTIENVLQLQSELALEIAARINAVVTPQESARIASAKPVDPEAYGYYVQGRHFWNLRTRGDLETARSLFERAVAADPDFALAHVGLADAILVQAQGVWVPRNPSVQEAKRAALRALELDPQSGEAYAALAMIASSFEWDWAEAERAFDICLELSPGYATGHQWFGVMRHAQGMWEEALGHLQKARDLDPASPIIGMWLAQALARSGQAEASLRVAQPLLETYGNNTRVLGGMVDVYSRLGQFEDALRMNARLTDESSRYFRETTKARLLARLNRTDEARTALEEALRLTGSDAPRPSSVAAAYAALGETDEAFAWLERAFETRDFFLIQIKNQEPFDAIRTDPRYSDLLRRMGLPE